MSSIKYCDGRDGECRKTADEAKLYYVPQAVAIRLAKKGWVFSEYDVDLCKECIEDYYNEEDEQLIIVDGHVQLGKDFKEKS